MLLRVQGGRRLSLGQVLFLLTLNLKKKALMGSVDTIIAFLGTIRAPSTFYRDEEGMPTGPISPPILAET